MTAAAGRCKWGHVASTTQKKAPSEDGANPWRNADEDITGVGYLPTEV